VSSSVNIFISHSSKDECVATLFIDEILKAGIGLTGKIMCTSTSGYKLNLGKDIDSEIKSFIANSSVSVFLLSHNFYASKYCLCEMGAVWVLSKRCVFFVIPPMEHSESTEMFQRYKFATIDSEEDLFHFANDIKDEFNINVNIPNYRRKVNDFIKHLTNLDIPETEIVSLKAHEALKTELTQYKEDNSKLTDENNRLSILCEEIKRAKSSEEISKMEICSLPEHEQLELLISNASDAIKKIKNCRIVRECLFYYFRGENFSTSSAEHLFDELEISRAIEFKQVAINEGALEPDENDSAVALAISKVRELRDFASEASVLFIDTYNKSNTHPLDLEHRGFWQDNLGL
jgi:hypothetical protein